MVFHFQKIWLVPLNFLISVKMKDQTQIFCFISFQVSSFCFVMTKPFFRVPFSAIQFCNRVACSLRFSKSSKSSYLSSLFSDFRQLFRTYFYLVFYLCFWFIFTFLNFSFFGTVLNSDTYFLSSAFSSSYQGFWVLCQILIDPDFPPLCMYSIKKQPPVKQKFC